ncbi:hypothetical protein PHYPSEUDO_006372 [Phytophthora pseudosyringae]|uniref:Uncharacterized protein n=1 Tax=Phytophthora pseudosyringae TaxID=221518 RepID=A0A8T1WE47_9STRA|nr:hypothetical protein PHYPSEUDO_006372 [Phytophthora pseudosyringae]
MLRIGGGRCLSATRNSGAYRALGRSAYSALHSQDAVEGIAATRSSALHVGVLGLGAIGTIFFTRLGLLAIDSEAKRELPTLTVDAFIKPERFEAWTAMETLRLRLEAQKEETLEFRAGSDGKVATVSGAPNVRVRTLESVGEDSREDDKLDVLLVAVKATDWVKCRKAGKEGG